MAVSDTKSAANPSADAKPAVGHDHDHATDKKVGSNAIADPNKLHADAYTKPADKSAVKPGAEKPAAPAAPKPAVPAAVHAEKPAPPAPSGLWGWISGTEKSAEDAWTGAKKYVKAEVSGAVASAEKVVATVLPAAAPAPHEAAHKPDPKTDSSSPKPAAKAADPAPATQAQTDAMTGVASTASWLLSKAVDYAKSGLSQLAGSPTEAALFTAAALVAGPEVAVVAGAAAAGVTGGNGLIDFVGYAGQAVQGFQKNFGNVSGSGAENFAQVAQQVDDIYHIPQDTTAPLENKEGFERDKSFALESAKAAKINWMIPGDNKPGGGTSLVSKDGHIVAQGVSDNGTPIDIDSTPEKQVARVGAQGIEQTKEGTKLTGDDYDVVTTGTVIRSQQHGSKTFSVYDTATGEMTVTDGITHQSYRFHMTKGGLVTDWDSKTQVTQATGDANDMAKNADANPHGTKYYIDKNGNMAAITADGVRYDYFAKENRMEILKGDKLMKLDLHTGVVQLFQVDPVTHALTLQKADAKHLPAGWTVLADGSVNINGSVLSKDMLRLEGAFFDVKNKILHSVKPEGPSIQATGDSTVQTGPDHAKIVVPSNGPDTITVAGVTMHADPATGKISQTGPSGETVTVGPKGVELNTHGQITSVDTQRNVETRDPQNRVLLSMNSQGDVRLYDGTQISHTGAVYNASRNISEPVGANGQSASEVVKSAAARAEALASMADMPGGLDGSIASLQALLSALNSLGDVPELAEQIGAAKATVEAKLAAAEAKEPLNAELFHAGKDDATIEKAFALHGAGASDGQIMTQLTQPQGQAVGAIG